MLLNGAPLNAVTLNGAPAIGVVVLGGDLVVSVLWGVRVLLAGVDISEWLTGVVRIEREEKSATLADFVMVLGDGAVNPGAFTGRTVEIYYQDWKGGSWVERLRFKGQIIRPQYNLQARTLSCNCSDRVQDDVEKLTVAQVDALCGGLHSADIFEQPAGRSRWDYAHERLSTRPASLQKSVEGVLQVTNWAATAPAFVFRAGSVIDGSLDYTPVELSDRINVVELEIDYRFSRLRERHQVFGWRHPDIVGDTIDATFCIWRHDTSELPDISMVEEACKSAGYQAVLGGAHWIRVPPTGVYCTPPSGWNNDYTDLLLGATWTAARRWSQAITEQYRLRIESPASIAQAGEVIRRDSINAETASDREQAFTEAEFTAADEDATQDALGDWVVDLRENARLDLAVAVGVSMAQVQIIEAHRGNRVAFQLPTSDTLGMLLEHTIQVEDEVAGRTVRAAGKLFSLIDEWDISSGSALTTVSLAISQGGGAVTDPVVTPDPPATTPAGDMPSPIGLETQLGGHIGGPAYDDELLGFAGNYDNYNTPGVERFERRLHIEMPEIPADHQDEFVATRSATYRVAIANDLLEL